MTPNDWTTLVASIRDQECLIFLGAGASTVPDGEVGLPTATDLARQLAQECHYPGPDLTDFLRICQYYELMQDGHRLRKSIIKKIAIAGLMPGKLHTLIAKLPIKFAFTTNYDRLMETALQIAGKRPQVAVYDINGRPQPNVNSVEVGTPLVYKLHGTMDDPSSMLCTEDDIVQFSACVLLGDPPLLTGIKQLFENHTILFICYGLKDWNIRTMIRALRGHKRKGWVRSFALQRQLDMSDFGVADWTQSVMYWDKKENVHCLDFDAISFMETLLQHYDAAP